MGRRGRSENDRLFALLHAKTPLPESYLYPSQALEQKKAAPHAIVPAVAAMIPIDVIYESCLGKLRYCPRLD